MTFKEAFEAMKHGAKVKLPGWNGYWCWDDEKQTIMIHCRPKDSDKGQGDVLDIRETQRVEYTFMHTQRDDWMIADEENCGVLGGQSTFGFGDAIRYLKRGLKVARKGWNGKKQYIQLATGISYKTADGEIVNCEHDAIGNMAIAFVGTSGVQIPLCFLAKSLENMSLCHAAYFCKGWENARGCKIEHDAAVAYGLEIIYEED